MPNTLQIEDVFRLLSSFDFALAPILRPVRILSVNVQTVTQLAHVCLNNRLGKWTSWQWLALFATNKYSLERMRVPQLCKQFKLFVTISLLHSERCLRINASHFLYVVTNTCQLQMVKMVMLTVKSKSIILHTISSAVEYALCPVSSNRLCLFFHNFTILD